VKSIVLIIVLLSLYALCFAQQIFIERIGQRNLFTIIYPVDNITYNLNVSNKLIVQAFIVKDDEMVSKHNDIITLNPISNKEQYLFYQYTNLIEPGKYYLYLKFDNRSVNRISEKRYPIIVPEESKNCSGFYLTYYNNGNLFMPSESDWTSLADSVRISFFADQIPAKLFLANEKPLANLPKVCDISIVLPDSLMKHNPKTFRLEYSFGQETHSKNYEVFSPRRLVMTKYSLKDQLAQLNYIMTQNEFKAIRKVPKSKLQDEINNFWDSHDPNPATEENEFQQLIYKRILEADNRYSNLAFKPGWKTDFGKVYIKYGDPDEIIKENYMVGKYPVEIWIYHKLDKSFYFDDKKGFGYYELRNYSNF